MKPDSALILGFLEEGKYILTRHARVRAQERAVRPRDLRSLGKTGAIIYEENDPRKFRIFGFDYHGEPLTAVAVYEFELLIITLF